MVVMFVKDITSVVYDELDSKSIIVVEIAAGRSKTNGTETRRVIPVRGEEGMTSLMAITSGLPGPNTRSIVGVLRAFRADIR